MKKKNFISFHLKLLSLILIIQLFSCEKDSDVSSLNDSNYDLTQENLETLQEGIIFPDENIEGLKSSTNANKKIKNIQVIRNDNNDNLMYVINFKNGGFIIYSADKRAKPIRAFSLKGEFNTDNTKFNSGLKDWYKLNIDVIDNLKKSNIEQSEEMKIAWKKQSIQNLFNSSAKLAQKAPDPELEPLDPLDDSYCTDYYKTVGPLIGTAWYQSGSFNDALNSSYNCETADPEPPVGCVAIAIGQIMYYHKHPSSYNWSSMSLTSGTTETQILLKEIGDAVNMHYDCDGSWAYTWKIDNAFTGHFSYSSAVKQDYTWSAVVQELNWGKPVLLSGSTNRLGTKGHAWVCEGYIRSSTCIERYSGVWLYMNWGWGSSRNGYYTFDAPNGSNYQYNQNMFKIRE